MPSLFRRILWGLIIVVSVAVLALSQPGAAAAGGGCRGEKSTEAAGTTVKMVSTCFVPTVLHAGAGETITFQNASDVPHSVAGATLEWGNYTEHQPGESVTATFTKPGVYPYYCFVHNGMIGAIVVGETGTTSAAPRVQAQADRGAAPTSLAAAADSASLVSDGGSSNLAYVFWAVVGATVVLALVAIPIVRRRHAAPRPPAQP